MREFQLCNVCDLEPDMAAKLHASMIDRSPENIARDRGLHEALLLWDRCAKLSNMHTERLLSQIKAACPEKSGKPWLERMVAAGLLTQWNAAHLAAGGRDIKGAQEGRFGR